MPDQPPPITEKKEEQEQPKLDPYVQNIMDSMKVVLPPEPGEKTIVPVALSEAVVQSQNVRAKTADKTDATDKTNKEPPKETPKEVPKETPKEAPKETAKEEPTVTRPVIKLVKRTEPPAPAKPAKTPEQEAAEAQSQSDKDYIESLTPEQKEELEFARWAEAKGKNGLYDQTLAYYRKVDDFIEAHPGMDFEQSDEYEKFLEDNRPKWNEAERRRLERQMNNESALKAADELIEKRISPALTKVKAMELKPVIEQAVSSVEAIITTADPANDKVVPIDKKVAARIKEVGYAQAVKEYKVEAPIIQSTLDASRAFLELTNQLTRYDEHNPMHQWLVGFIARESANMKSQPDSVRIVDGKSFLPMNELLDLQRKNPEEAAKHWTFSDEMVLDLIANNALLLHTEEVKALEQSGWKRAETIQKKEETQQTTPKKEETEQTAATINAPRAGARSVPGSVVDDKPASEYASFFELLVPGSSKIIGKS